MEMSESLWDFSITIRWFSVISRTLLLCRDAVRVPYNTGQLGWTPTGSFQKSNLYTWSRNSSHPWTWTTQIYTLKNGGGVKSISQCQNSCLTMEIKKEFTLSWTFDQYYSTPKSKECYFWNEVLYFVVASLNLKKKKSNYPNVSRYLISLVVWCFPHHWPQRTLFCSRSSYRPESISSSQHHFQSS